LDLANDERRMVNVAAGATPQSPPRPHIGKDDPGPRNARWMELLRLLLLAIEIASRGLAAKRPPAWTRLSTQVDSQL